MPHKIPLFFCSWRGMKQFHKAQKDDPICSTVIRYTQNGWPARHAIKGILTKYWGEKGKLSAVLLYGTRVVMPESLQCEILMKIHHGPQGIQRCRLRISSSVWWPGVSKLVESSVTSCPMCMKNTPPPMEPMLQSSLPKPPIGESWRWFVPVERFYIPGSGGITIPDIWKYRSWPQLHLLEFSLCWKPYSPVMGYQLSLWVIMDHSLHCKRRNNLQRDIVLPSQPAVHTTSNLIV